MWILSAQISAQTGSTWVVSSAGWQSWLVVSLLYQCALSKHCGIAAKSQQAGSSMGRGVSNTRRKTSNRKNRFPSNANVAKRENNILVQRHTRVPVQFLSSQCKQIFPQKANIFFKTKLHSLSIHVKPFQSNVVDTESKATEVFYCWGKKGPNIAWQITVC